MKPLIAAVVMAVAAIGKPAPDFTAENLKGESVSLVDFKDKVVVLEWVNFECPFVRACLKNSFKQMLGCTFVLRSERNSAWRAIQAV